MGCWLVAPFGSFLGVANARLSPIGQGPLILTCRQSAVYSLLPQGIVNGIAGSKETSLASPTDPVAFLPGMALIVVDSDGRLLRLLANPNQTPMVRDMPRTSVDESTLSPNWSDLITSTVLDVGSVREVDPDAVGNNSVPRFAFSERRLWHGSDPGHPENRVKVEAAAWGRHLIWIEVRTPWDEMAADTGMPTSWYSGNCSGVTGIGGSGSSPQPSVGAWRLAIGFDRVQWTFLESASDLSVGAGIWLAYIALNPSHEDTCRSC